MIRIESTEEGKILISTLKNKKLEKYPISRYGKHNLCYQNRNGDLYFTCENTNQKFIMDPRDIALSKELIIEFDATQAFYIGLLAGLKLNNSMTIKTSKKSKNLNLRIVK